MRPQDFQFIHDLVEKKSGISLSENKIYLIESRLEPVLKQQNLGSIEELVTRLRWTQDDELIDSVVDVMTTNETFFFRDEAPFEALRTHIIPTLIEKRVSEKRLNIWCAACSSGQEPYSLVMLIREHFPALQDWRISILATDISTEILEKAQHATYTQFEVDRGLPPSFLKYFESVEKGWKIKDEIKQVVSFERGNLIDPIPERYPQMDVILLRNVLIYFEQAVKRKILRDLKSVLRPDGFLFLGQSETVSQLDVPFKPCHIGTASCYQLSNKSSTILVNEER